MVAEAEHRGFALDVGVADVELGEEPIELRLGQRVGALVLDRVLRREHEERIGERMRATVDTHLMFLHRFEQRGLGLGWSAVDLVGEEQVGEDRTGPEHEIGTAQRHRAGEVGRQHVGCELHAPELDADRARERSREQRLRNTRNTFEQQVTADARGGEHGVDNVILADHDLADLGNDPVPQFVHVPVPSPKPWRGSLAATRPSASTRWSSTGASRNVAISSSENPSCRAANGQRFRARIHRQTRARQDSISYPVPERCKRARRLTGAFER